MLSIGRMASGQEKYYLNLAHEDYYLSGGEPPGKWRGKGAKTLGLQGTVRPRDLSRLFSGLSPDDKPLVQNAEKKYRRPGFDLTFSAPKSVSVLWSQGDAELRRIIQDSHDTAVQAALGYFETEACFSRRGKGGTDLVRADSIVATFEHGTSRALDPQLHTHCLVINATVGEDGQTGALEAQRLYHHKMVMGALYRAELSHQLQHRLNIEVERVGTWFELSAIPKALIDFFSKRRAAIQEKLRGKGLESASAAALATLSTREAKELIPPREELYNNWRQTGREHGFDPNETIRPDTKRASQRKPDMSSLVRESASKITEQDSHFSEKDLLRVVAEDSQVHGFSAHEIRTGVKAELEAGYFVVLGKNRHDETRYTTQEMFELERTLIDKAVGLSKRQSHDVPTATESVIRKLRNPRSPLFEELQHHAAEIVRASQRKKTDPVDRKKIKHLAPKTLNEEQVEAVRTLTGINAGNIRILEGVAGSGKTTTLFALRLIFEREGYRVIGTSLSGKATKELERDTGIKSFVFAGLEQLMNPTFAGKLTHHAKQLIRAAAGKSTIRPRAFAVDKDMVLIVDEAGMLGTRQMTKLIDAVQKGGGILILVGDRKQLQPIEAGGPFAHLADKLGRATLENIARQKDEADRKVVKATAEGNAEIVLKDLADRGRLFVEKNRNAAIEKLVDEWSAREAHQPKDSQIFCGTNQEASEINQRCQEKRKIQSPVPPSKKVRNGDSYLHHGDRVIFTSPSRSFRVQNGQMGTIVSVNRERSIVTVQLDAGERRRISLRHYADLRLGYAVTTHKGQGTTVERAYVLAGGAMQDLEISYVQLSRARESTFVFTDEQEAGPKLTNLARQMSTSRAKNLAHDVVEANQPMGPREPRRHRA